MHARWHRHLKRHALVAAAFVLLASVGGSGLVPVKTLAAHVPHGTPFSLDSVLAAASFAIHSPAGNVPLTLVDVDEELYAQWGRPCLTPRERLAQLIAATAARGPSAIVVDVSLGCSAGGACCAADGTNELIATLRDYQAAAPLVLVREVQVQRDGSPAADRLVIGETPVDAAVAGNPRVSWAAAFYVTDDDGTVRTWREAWRVCKVPGHDAQSQELASVPSRVRALVGARDAGRTGESHATGCALQTQSGREHLLLLGQRVLAGGADRNDPGAPRRLPARLLLDRALDVDEGGYYSLSGRVAIIGNSHAASQDKWRTAVGVLPGMELIAHMIRFSGLQSRAASYWPPLLQTVAAFLMLAAIYFFLRPLVATLVATFSILAFATLCGSLFGWIDVFESLGNAIWLFVGYALVLALVHFIEETRKYRGRRKARTVLAERIKKDDPEWQPRA